MSTRVVLATLERAAKKSCYQCEANKPHKPYSYEHRSGTKYVHLRECASTWATPNNGDCRAQGIWIEYEAAGGKIMTAEKRKRQLVRFHRWLESLKESDIPESFV